MNTQLAHNMRLVIFQRPMQGGDQFARLLITMLVFIVFVATYFVRTAQSLKTMVKSHSTWIIAKAVAYVPTNAQRMQLKWKKNNFKLKVKGISIKVKVKKQPITDN